MSVKKRQMATVKTGNSSSKSKIWLRRVVSVVLFAGVLAVLLKYQQPTFQWLNGLAQTFALADDDEKRESLQTSASEDEGWQVELVTPTEFVSAKELEQYVKMSVKESFFSLDVQAASETLLTHPWVKNVKARKVWPNTLLVDVEEHQPWLNLNNKQLISKEGVVFEPQSVEGFSELPLLIGNYGDIEDLLSMYHFFTEQMPADEFRITKLSFHVYNGWTMWLENGIRLYLGKQHLSERLERFLSVLHEMKKQQRNQISYIDLRYPSGVAVGWKEQSSEQQVARN
jgi:cell division protein FtsQ